MLFKTHRKNSSIHSDNFFHDEDFITFFPLASYSKLYPRKLLLLPPSFPLSIPSPIAERLDERGENMCAAAFIIRTIPIVPTDYIVRLCCNTLCVLSALTNSLVFLHSVATFYIDRFFQPEKRKDQPASDSS